MRLRGKEGRRGRHHHLDLFHAAEEGEGEREVRKAPRGGDCSVVAELVELHLLKKRGEGKGSGRPRGRKTDPLFHCRRLQESRQEAGMRG